MNNVSLVEKNIAENPDTLTQRWATQIGMSRRPLQISLKNLHLFLFKIHMVQALQTMSLQSHLVYANFLLNGFVKKQNCQYELLMIQELFMT